jgi:hypothetical protein
MATATRLKGVAQTHLVEQAEDVVLVHQVADCLNHRPGCLLEVAVTQAGEGLFVHDLNLRDVALPVVVERFQGEGRGSVRNGSVGMQCANA